MSIPNWYECLDQLVGGTQGTAIAPDGLSAETALLHQLSLADVARRAGYVLEKVELPTMPPPAPDEILPACSQRAMECLTDLSRERGSIIVVMMEWFIIVASKGKRLPHSHLSYYLSFCKGDSHWIPYVAPVIGERGRWIVKNSTTYIAMKAYLKKLELWEGKDLPLVEAPPITPEIAYLEKFRAQLLEVMKDE
jgi:hypothetical protein